MPSISSWKYSYNLYPGIQDNRVLDSVVKDLEIITANNDKETYHFINLLRFCSQLTISPAHFEKNYVQKISDILNEWEKDGDFDEKVKTVDMFSFDIAQSGWRSKKLKKSGIPSRLNMRVNVGSNMLSSYLGWMSKPAPDDLLVTYVDRTCNILDKHEDDRELIEQNTVFYFCGYRLKKDMFRWIVDRKRMRKRFMKYKPHIDRMQSFSPTVFTYRTFYLSVCRTKNAYEAMLDGRPGKMTYGDLDFEWFTCMQVPDLLDAERIVRDLMFQCVIRILRFRNIKIRKVIELLMMWKKLNWIKTDPVKS